MSLSHTRSLVHFFTCLLVVAGAFTASLERSDLTRETENERRPNDWFYRQRAYPQGYIDYALRKASLTQARQLQSREPSLSGRARLQSPLWLNRGPSNIGGRITAMAISRQHPATLYIGAADGGVLKSTNAGAHWTALFDDQPSLSIGAVAVDPYNDDIVYVGTGEVNSSGDSYDGFGMVKTTDGGATWFPLGLDSTRHIGQIVIDPRNPATLYVASMGTLFTPNTTRGVYKSTNGGTTWTHSLFVNDSTGVVDLAINPQQPGTLLAAAWQRMRGPQGRLYVGGTGTGIYRTTDGGATWTLLSGGLPPPGPRVGRPGVAIAPSNPSVAYVCYADDPGNFLGVYRSADGGDTWFRTSDGPLASLYSNFGWYFGKIYVHPADENNVFVLGVYLARTPDGGVRWSMPNTVHVDHHAMAFHPDDPTRIYIGDDGGFETSANSGASWSRLTNQDLAITQFYAGWISALNPGNTIGGTQDNGSIRTQSGNVSDWKEVNGGDGFYCIVDYSDTNYQYAESQYGGIVRTTDGWRVRTFTATDGIGATDRTNWSAPLAIDPTTPRILYTGTHRLYKSSDHAAYWTAISPDLTNGPTPGFPAYATITTIDVATADSNIIMVGTDDANVWVTIDGGSSWNKVSGTLPDRWITRVRFDPVNAQIAYVTLSGYRSDSRLPHIFKTTDLGTSWQDISSNLPEAPVNTVLVDPQNPDRLYIGTDVGTYYTTNGGGSWSTMGTGLPNVVVDDMQIHAASRIVRAFTHGRSIWELRLDELSTTGVAEGAGPHPGLQLDQNYPNPFNPNSEIRYLISEFGHVKLSVYDVLGREVSTLVNEEQAPGTYTVRFPADGPDVAGLPSGIYFYQLRSRGASITKKMILMR